MVKSATAKRRGKGESNSDAAPSADRAMTSYNDGLSEISQLLQAGAAAGDGKALQWAEVLDAALSSKVSHVLKTESGR